MIRRSAMTLLVATLLIAASCGEVVEPEGFALPPSTTEPVAEVGEAQPQPDADAPDTSSLTVANNFVPTPPPGYVPSVLVTTPGVLLTADVDGTTPLAGTFAGLGASRVYDDLLGGLVLEEVGLGGDVLWYPAGGEEPQVIDDTGAELLDVGFFDGSASAVLLVDGSKVESVRLVDNVRTELMTLADDEEVLGLSASGGLQAVVIANEACGELRFVSAAGESVDLGGPGEPRCVVPRRPAFGAVALSPDGGALVYTDVAYRDDGIEVATDLMAIDLDTGEEYYSQRIAEDGGRVSSLTFDGTRVAYLLETTDETNVVVLDLTPGGPVARVDLLGLTSVESVTFARNPVTGS